MGSGKAETVGDLNPQPVCSCRRSVSESHLQRSSGGFSLLELLIVLGIMIGLVALIWPSLQRPLVDADLQAGGVQLRDALQQARQDALATGVPLLLQVQRGSGEFWVGPWDQLLLHRLGASASLTLGGELDSSSGAPSPSLAPNRPAESPEVLAWKRRLALRSERLPDDVMVEEVLWKARLPETEPWAGEVTLSSALPPSDLAESGLSESGFSTATAAEEAQDWFVPMMSNGNSPDVTLILRDVKTRRAVALHLAGSTGMSRLEPLPDGWREGGQLDVSVPDTFPGRANSPAPTTPSPTRVAR